MCNRQIELPLQPAPTAVPLTEKNLSLHQYGFDVLLRKSADITMFYVGVDSLGRPSLGDRASNSCLEAMYQGKRTLNLYP